MRFRSALIFPLLAVSLSPLPVFAQCQDITERMSDGNADQRAAITARVKVLRDQGRDVYVTAKSTYSTIHAVCKPIPPAAPVDCAVSTWTCAAPVWGSCVNGTQTGTQQCTRTILTPSANGGASCPALNEVRTVSQSCVVTPPPPAQCADGIDNDKDGFVDTNDPGCSGATDNDETNAAPTPGDVVFEHRFEQDISRSDPNAAQLWLTTGWSHVKTSQTPGSGARGFLYTTSTVPGYTGPLPGGGQRVAVIEAQGAGGQTDFYFGLGSEAHPANTIPGDVWFQWWEYVAPGSRFGTRDKWLYPCNTGYGCHSHLWMFMKSCLTYLSSGHAPLGCPSAGTFGVVRQSDGVSFIENTTGDPDARGNFGPQNTSVYMEPGRWNLIKIHFDTTNGASGKFEMWIKPMGGQFTKVADWVGGVTPGFTWTIPAASVGGHRVLRFPSTVDNDFIVYMDDFMIARTEAALRQYQ